MRHWGPAGLLCSTLTECSVCLLCLLSCQSFESTKELLVVWVLDGRLVGVLLEGGTADMQVGRRP